MRYSSNRNYRDSMIEEVNKLIEKIDKENKKPDFKLFSFFSKTFDKIKLYMSYLKLK